MSKHSMWGGRFKESPTETFLQWSSSLEVDRHLAPWDIMGSLAHAHMLFEQGLLTREEFALIESGFKQVKQEIVEEKFSWDDALEDVHMNLESRLTELIGEAGAKLHTGRSRNDQVLTTVRLYLKEHCLKLVKGLGNLIQSLIKRAKLEQEVPFPGFTHFQCAQPVALGHYWLAYCSMFRRDKERLEQLLVRLDTSILGAGALAGSTLPLNPKKSSEYLGFSQVFTNSLDAVSDRDFFLDFYHWASVFMMHCSRWSEEMICWSNPAFSLVELPESLTTGSSMMPQKRNPDFWELLRGRTSYFSGAWSMLMTNLKGLPLAYNRDLQEDKVCLVRSVRILLGLIPLMEQAIREIEIDYKQARALAGSGGALATDLAESLVLKGVSFREAHSIVGKAVALSEELGCKLSEVPLARLQELSSKISADDLKELTPDDSLKKRSYLGASGYDSVAAQLKLLGCGQSCN